MPQPSSQPQRQFFILFLLALLPAGNALNPCLDVDTWWHLRVGQYIVREGKLPEQDPFSQLGQQEKVPWIAYSWLYELGLYEAFRVGGYPGIMCCRIALDLMMFGGIAWLLLNHGSRTWIALGALALVTVSLLPFTPERPWHFTIFFTTLTLHAMLEIRHGASVGRFAWLPFVYVVWANVHIQFVMGFALLGMTWLIELFERMTTRESVGDGRVWRLFLLGVACAAATLATPFHFRLYLVIWEYASQTAALSLVSELLAPDLTRWWNLPLVVLLIVAAFTVSRRRLPPWDTALLASALFFSLRMQRDLWYGVLIAAALIVRDSHSDGDRRTRFTCWKVIAICGAATMLMRLAGESVLLQGKTFASRHAESYPVAAVDHICKNMLSGPMFNDFDWGGYLIWALPELPVSIDGRTNLYGEQRLKRSMNTWAGVDWENDPQLMTANVIIAPKKKGYPLVELLRERPDRWKIEYEDSTAVLFTSIKGQ